MRFAAFAVALFLVPAAARAQEGLARADTLARQNQQAKDALAFVQFQAGKIHDPALKTATADLLANPAPTFMTAWPDAAAREDARKQLADAGLIAADVTAEALFPPLKNALKAPQAYLTAPAGTPDHHHGYPGGLAVHSAFNLQAALDLGRNYRGRYGVTLDPDLLIAAPILHDVMKSWAFQWKADGSITPQSTIAATGSHHVFGIAEALHRGLSPRFVVTLASAHDAPAGDTAARVVGYLRAAAILAKVDPIAGGLLKKEGDAWSLASLPPIEATVNHLSDHDYVFTDPAAAIVAATLDRLGQSAAKTAVITADETRLRWMRHRVHTRLSGVQIYAWILDGGDDRVSEELTKRAIKLVDKNDLPAF